MCSGSEAGSHLRLIAFVYHSTLGLRVIKKKSGEARTNCRLAALRFSSSSSLLHSRLELTDTQVYEP